MPSWRLHAKWGDLVIGFHSKEIDEVIDRREVMMQVGMRSIY